MCSHAPTINTFKYLSIAERSLLRLKIIDMPVKNLRIDLPIDDNLKLNIIKILFMANL